MQKYTQETMQMPSAEGTQAYKTLHSVTSPRCSNCNWLSVAELMQQCTAKQASTFAAAGLDTDLEELGHVSQQITGMQNNAGSSLLTTNIMS